MITTYFLIYLTFGGYGTNGAPVAKTFYRFENMATCQKVVAISKSKDLRCVEVDVLKGQEDKPYTINKWF